MEISVSIAVIPQGLPVLENICDKPEGNILRRCNLKSFFSFTAVWKAVKIEILARKKKQLLHNMDMF